MTVKLIGKKVIVSLSKRNLLALLHKVDSPTSARTLIKAVQGDADQDLTLLVIAEPDEIHYADGGAYGKMSPETEEFIKFHSKVH